MYSYRVPDEMMYPPVGVRVLVPLGKKEIVGIVYGKHQGALQAGIVLRNIVAQLDEEPIVTAEQLCLWQWIASYYMCPIGDVLAAALPKKIGDKGYSFSPVKKRRVSLPNYTGEIETIHLLDAQQENALHAIHSAWINKDVVLLHGVTSSGKTEVYMHLIEEQLSAGKQVLYLVPEIALTTQLTDRLQRVFGEKVVVYHSRVSDGLRAEIYRQQLMPNPRLIVGARSAVFLPFNNLGFVIVDEEHDPSYHQQDPAPRYHGRSVAIMLAHFTKAKVLLGSATPSVESYHNALEGKYGLVTMRERYAGLQLPKITLIDLTRQYHRKEMYGHFSDPLVLRIREELAHHKQIILFQNRRGYAPVLQCMSCGATPRCQNCDVPLTVHMRARRLTCHYCGYTIPLPSQCPSCGGDLKVHGFGTERIEDEVLQLFPEARVLRMDLDSTGKKEAHEEIIGAFSRHEVDILIGTQMVSKGLHFDDVSLVAVLNADSHFNQPDFRCYERAFQLLEQVSGRAGRKGSQGEVIIQTYQPNHPLYTYLLRHDYQSFYEEQLSEREMFHYSPFSRLITLTIRHNESVRVLLAANRLQQQLSQVFGERCSVVIEPPISRVNKYFLRVIQLRIESNANISRAKVMIQEQIDQVLAFSDCKGVQVIPEVD